MATSSSRRNIPFCLFFILCMLRILESFRIPNGCLIGVLSGAIVAIVSREDTKDLSVSAQPRVEIGWSFGEVAECLLSRKTLPEDRCL